MHTEETGKNFNEHNVIGGFLQEQRMEMENVHDIVNEGSHPPWAEFLGEFGHLLEHTTREYGECVQYLSFFLRKKFCEEILNVKTLDYL